MFVFEKSKAMAMVGARLVERSLLTPEIRGSNPVIGKYYFLSIVLKRRIWRKKRPWLAHILSTYLPLTWNKTVFPRFNDISGLSYLITYLLIRDPRFKSSQRANFILSISTYLLGTKQYFPDSMTSVDTGILLNQISTNQSGTTCPADCQTT